MTSPFFSWQSFNELVIINVVCLRQLADEGHIEQ
jgi:hypothetical protein